MIVEYTIKEAVQELKISKATFYNRINKYKQDLKNEIYLKDGKKYISVHGLEILKSNSCLNSLDNCLDSENNTKNDETLQKENDFLKNQLIEKDKQIQTLSRLIENSQILLKQEQQAKLLLIDSKEKGIFSKLKNFFS